MSSTALVQSRLDRVRPRSRGARHGGPLERRRQERDALVERYLPLAHSLARRYSHAGTPMEDLQQVAAVGLINAANRFDPTRGVAFSTFAVPTILGELRRHFRDHAWATHVPRSVQERTAAVRQANEDFMRENGHAPGTYELAERLGCSSEEVVDALLARASNDQLPLDTPTGTSEDATLTIADRLGDIDEGYERVEDRDAVLSVLGLLTDREREIIVLRYVDELTQVQIADRLEVSQMQISRTLRAAIGRLAKVAAYRSAPHTTGG
jgi:RNA polymerase sigma-B factor